MNNKNKTIENIINIVLMTVGAFVMGIGFNGFLMPFQFVTGGVSGISIILEDQFGIGPAYSQWAMNIPLFILGWSVLGNKYGIKTIYGTLIFPFAVLITQNIEPLTSSQLLAALYGGICIGLGLGLIFKAGGSTGGLDTPAQILHKYRHISLGRSIAFFDFIVIVSGIYIFDVEKGLYAFIALYTTSKTIDLIQMGGRSRKSVYIISSKHEEIKQAIFDIVERGCTQLPINGGYTNESKTMLLVILEVQELPALKKIVNDIDPSGFMFISETSEVHGEGFLHHM